MRRALLVGLLGMVVAAASAPQKLPPNPDGKWALSIVARERALVHEFGHSHASTADEVRAKFRLSSRQAMGIEADASEGLVKAPGDAMIMAAFLSARQLTDFVTAAYLDSTHDELTSPERESLELLSRDSLGAMSAMQEIVERLADEH